MSNGNLRHTCTVSRDLATELGQLWREAVQCISVSWAEWR